MRSFLLATALLVSLAPEASAQGCVENPAALLDDMLGFPRVHAVSPDGRAYVGDRGSDAFRWSPEAGLSLVSPSFGSEPDAVSSGGGYAVRGGSSHLQWWDFTAGAYQAAPSPSSDITYIAPVAVATDGTVFGYFQTGFSTPPRDFRWTPEDGFGPVAADPINLVITGASADGRAVVGGSFGRGYIWREGADWTLLDGFPDDLPEFNVRVEGLSADGRYVTGQYRYRPDGATRSTYVAYRWENGSVTTLTPIAGSDYPEGIQVADDGTVFGEDELASGDELSVVWRGGAPVPFLDDLAASGLGTDFLALRYGIEPDESADAWLTRDGRAFALPIQSSRPYGDPSGSYEVVRLDGGCERGIASGYLPISVRAGDDVDLVWAVSGLEGTMTIEWSADSVAWSPVAAVPVRDLDAGGSGAFPWTVPDTTAEFAYLRFSSEGEEEIAGPFLIEPGTAQWVGTIPYPYTEPDAWSIGEAPSPGFAVVFSDPDDQYASAATFFEDASARSATVDDVASFDLNGFTYTLRDALTIGTLAGVESRLVVQGGSLASGDVTLGLAAAPARAALELGLGTHMAALTTGLLTVSRSDSASVSVGAGSSATLRDGLWIASEASGDGEVDVSGGTLQVTEGGLGTRIGDEGRGALSVSAGGVLSLVGPVDVGAAVGSSGLLTLTDGASGATLGSMRVGSGGTGGLEVTGGAALQSAAVTIGAEAGAFGTALLEGTGSRWDVAGPMLVGAEGAALFQLQGGATFCKRDASTYAVGPQGTVQIAGEVVVGIDVCPEAAPEAVAPEARARPGGAVLAVRSLHLSSGATLEADAVRLEAGGSLGGDGALARPLTNAGTLAPGGEGVVGTFAIGADYAQASGGALAVEIGAEGADRLNVSGAVALDGTLAVSLLGGHVPAVGDAVTVLTGASVTGAFTTVALPDGIEAGVAVTADAVTLTITGVTVATDPEPRQRPSLSVAPNPASGAVRVTYALSAPGHVHLSAHDALGREVAALARSPQPAGDHTAWLDLSGLPPGVYFIRLDASGDVRTRALTVVR